MRLIGVIATSLWLSACTTPMFPPVVTQDVESSTFNVKAWVHDAYHSSNTAFVPHKVKLGGKILQVIRNQEGMVILAEKRPISKADPTADPTSIEENDAPWFAITFQGYVAPGMLQTGNRLIAVGTTNRASAEMFGGAARMLPHLRAQCLHFWNDAGVSNVYVCPAGKATAARASPDEDTFCFEGNTAGSVPSGNQGEPERSSGGL